MIWMIADQKMSRSDNHAGSLAWALPMLGIFLAVASVSAQPVAWSWLAPQPQGNEIKASAYDPQRDLTVAVGDFGTIMVRTASGPWEVRQVRAAGRFSCVTWTGKVFVAGSEIGMFRSSDGLAWSRISFGPISQAPGSGQSSFSINGEQRIIAIATSATNDTGITVALAGDASVVWVSRDEGRLSWTKHALPTTPKPADAWFSYTGMSFGRGLFVAVGTHGFVSTSANGTAWTKRASGTRRDLDFMAFNGAFFVAMDSDNVSNGNHAHDNTDSRVVRSADGINWTAIAPEWPRQSDGNQEPVIPTRPLAAGTRFLIDAAGSAYVSGNFISWSKIGQPADVFYLNNLQATGSTTGNRTLVFLWGGAMFSLGGTEAELRKEIEDSQLGFGASVGGLDNLLVGSNNSWSALDGKAGNFLDSNGFWTDSVFQQRGFLVGSQGSYSDTKNFALLERNPGGSGRWVSKGATAAPLPGKLEALAAASTAGPVVCLLRSTDEKIPHRLYYSADWNDWELIASYPADQKQYSTIMQLEHDGQRFVMLRPDRKIAVSTDGKKWDELPLLPDDSNSFRQRFHPNDSSIPTKNFPDAIASNGSRLIASTTKMATSVEGFTYAMNSVDGRFFVWDFSSGSPAWREFISPWASVPKGNRSSSHPMAPSGARTLVWNGSIFLKLPQEYSPEREPQAGRLFTSTNGETWAQREFSSQGSHVGWTGSQFVVLTDKDGVLVHRDGLSPEILSGLRITKQPDSVAAYNGETVNFEVIAETDLPGLSYQWHKDGKSIKNANKSRLSVNVSTGTAGRYHVVLRTANGTTAVSADAFLTLRPAASWSWQDGLSGDQVVKVDAGQSIELGLVNVVGPGQIRYQWFKDGTAIKGATGASLMLNGVTPTAAGVYTATITTSAGTVTTEPRRVAVTDRTQLVYSVKATSQVSRSVGQTANTETIDGYLVVDRSEGSPQAAFVWIGKSGSVSNYTVEQTPGADMRSTGPWSKTVSVLSRAHTSGVPPSQSREVLWVSGSDGLIKLDNTVSIAAPGTLSGWKNSVHPAGKGAEIRSTALSLILDKSLTLGNRGKNFDATLESLKTSLQSKGILPKLD